MSKIIEVSQRKYRGNPTYLRLSRLEDKWLNYYENKILPKNDFDKFISYLDGRKNTLNIINYIKKFRASKKELEILSQKHNLNKNLFSKGG